MPLLHQDTHRESVKASDKKACNVGWMCADFECRICLAGEDFSVSSVFGVAKRTFPDQCDHRGLLRLSK